MTQFEWVVWNTIGAIWLAALSTALLAHAYVGVFSRFISDDYCTAGALQTRGFFGAQEYWFTTWTGRYSFTVIISIIHFFGSKATSFVPGITIGLWLLALTWTLARLSPLDSAKHGTSVSFFLAGLVIVSSLLRTPAIYQSLYWETGVITYIFPLILLTIYIGLLAGIQRLGYSRRLWLLALSLCITFIAAGFSETYAALQGGALCLAILLCAANRKELFPQRLLPLLVAGLGGTGLAVLILVCAPGNEARIASSVVKSIGSPPRSLLAFIELSLRFGFDSVLVSVLGSRLTTVAAALALPMFVAFKLHSNEAELSNGRLGFRKQIKWLMLLPVVGFILIVLCFVPTAYVAAYMRGGYHPQPRLFVTSQFVFFCFICFWGYLAGITLSQSQIGNRLNASRSLWPVLGIVAVLLLVVPVGALRQSFALTSTVQAYASAWDDQDREIHAGKVGGYSKLTVRAVPGTSHDGRGNLYFGLRLMDSNPNNWVNGCAAQYYGVESIVAK